MIPLQALHRMGPVRFVLQFSARGAPNYGATGMTEGLTFAMQRLGLVEVFYRKRPNMDHAVGRRRLYRNVEVSVRGRLFAAHLRQELRERNLPGIVDIMDGHGRVAFEKAWKERRGDIVQAALRAWDRLPDKTEVRP